LLGSNNGVDFYPWNPDNFSVNRADTAGIADLASAVPWTGVSGRPVNVSSFANDVGYAPQSWVISNFFGAIEHRDTFSPAGMPLNYYTFTVRGLEDGGGTLIIYRDAVYEPAPPSGGGG
jgi:hypothetical protein